MASDISGTTGIRGFGRLPLSNIVPFSYRDGATFADILYGLRDYVNNVVIPDGNKNLEELRAGLLSELDTLESDITNAKNGWETSFNQFMSNVEENIRVINEDVIAEQIAPVVDLINIVKETIEDASDPTAYLNRVTHLLTVPARPDGTLWPQSFSINEEEGHVYIGYGGSLDGGVTPVQRITTYTLSGTLVGSRTFVTEAGTSSEGLVWFRNGLEELCFVVRPASAGRGYAIFNYDKNTMGPVIPLPGGNYKSAVAGDLFYTVNSNDSTNGFDEVYVYTFKSIRQNSPVLVETIRMESRNTMEKVQSFTVNGGALIFSHGKSKGQALLSAYSLTGKLITAYTFNSVELAEAINASAPGTIIDSTYYRHESEGAWVYKGKTITGHVVDNNSNDYKFVLLTHNTINGAEIESLPAAMEYDTGWKEITLFPPFVAWTLESRPMVRRIGNVVYVEGGIKGVPSGAFPALGHIICDLEGLGPFRQIELPVQKTSGTSVATWKIRPGGDLALSATSAVNAGPDTWYPFTFSWMMA